MSVLEVLRRAASSSASRGLRFWVIVDVDGRWTAIVDHCHCRPCTLVGGAVMATDVIVPRRTVRFEGEEHIVTYKSSEHVSRRFVRRSNDARS